jgi:colicin import membrane protein
VADAQRKLADTVAAHEKTLKGSAGKVADNKVRQQLRDALDAAIKSKASKDVKALGDNVSNVNAKAKAVTDAVAAKKKADEEAAARAAAAAAAAAKKSTSSYSYSGSGSGSGYSTGGSGSKSTYTPTATTQNNNTGGGNGLEGLDHLFHKKQKWTKDNPADWNDCTTWAAGC